MSSINSLIEKFHHNITTNRWHHYFYFFCRILLAFGFFVAGLVKIFGERFASGLSELHPMGAYLEALFHTGYYYTFIGIAQVIAAILLLFRKTVIVGALVYLPIIVNIFILSFAVRFEGSYITSPLMVLANIYILIWHYDKLKYIFNFKPTTSRKHNEKSKKFPFLFFGFVVFSIAGIIIYARYGHQVMPRNSYSDCVNQFSSIENSLAGINFCECIHKNGNSLNKCLDLYDQNFE